MAQKQITIAGREFTLSPVPAIGMIEIGDDFQQIGSGFTKAAVHALVLGLYYGCKRNHPDVTQDFFFWNVDPANMPELVDAFVEVNSVPGAVQGEAPAG